MVFRNEDTGWGWPPYFKFNSADITAKAQAFATDPAKPWVLVKSYGWRFRMTSSFPNVLNLRGVDRDYSHIPLFNIVVIGLLAAGVFLSGKKSRRSLPGCAVVTSRRTLTNHSRWDQRNGAASAFTGRVHGIMACLPGPEPTAGIQLTVLE